MRWLVGIVVSVSLLACHPAASQPHTSLTMGMSQFPPDMHPFITTTSIKDTILDAALRPVVGYQSDGKVICLLCTEVPSLANGLARIVDRSDGTKGMEVDYILRDDLVWGDGVPLTAADVVFAFKVGSLFNPPLVAESAKVIDAHRVRYVLKSVVYDFDRQATTPIPEHIEGPILAASKDAVDYGQKSAFNRAPETPGLWDGPYLVAQFKPNDQVALVPNPHWHGTAPYFQKITMRLIENTSALQANLLSGDVDVLATGNLGITLDQIISVAKAQAARFDVDFIPSVTSYEHLAVQLDNKLLADKRVRQAMAMAIDKPTIVARVFDNRFQAAGSFKHPSQFGWHEGTKILPYDPKAAKALLAEAGFTPGPDGILRSADGTRFSIDLVTTAGNRTRELVEQVLQTEMKAIGIDVVIKNEPARVMFGETLRKRSFTGLVEFQNDSPIDYVPLIYFHSAYIPKAETNFSGNNYSGWANPAMDEALTATRAELDPQRRLVLWQKILDLYADELPEIPLFFPAQGILTPKWMTGMVDRSRFGINTLWVENWRAR